MTAEMQKPGLRLLAWCASLPYVLSYLSLLVLWHPVCMLSKLFGQRAMDFVFYCVNRSLLLPLSIVGTRLTIRSRDDIPNDRPLLIVSNHQSFHDINIIATAYGKYHPKFVAKTQLARWIPSVSFVLRHFGSVLIDRDNPRQALPALAKFAAFIEARRFSAVIFPEGTRARDGQMKAFKPSGILSLLKHMPSAIIVPCVMKNSWLLVRDHWMPAPLGLKVELEMLEPIDPAQYAKDELTGIIEARIREALMRG